MSAEEKRREWVGEGPTRDANDSSYWRMLSWSDGKDDSLDSL
jgi:hypothetical protein